MKTSHPTNSQSTLFEKTLKVIIAILVFAALSLQFFALTSCSKNDDSPTPTPTPTSDLAISSFGPTTGPKNTSVVITGVGFSNNATSNVVTLNGKPCLVNQASTTQLNITIPPAAGTGNIQVTVNGFTVSSNTFTFIDTVTVSTLAGSTRGFANGTGSGARFDEPIGIASDATGNIFVTENEKIRKISPSGVVTTFAGSTFGFADGLGTAAQFNRPRGVAFDATGNLYVGDSFNSRIRKISTIGVVTTLAGSGTFGFADGVGNTAQFYLPRGIATDAIGNVYVSDSNNYKIRKISPTGVVTTYAGTTLGFADGVGVAAQFDEPSGVVIDASGNLFVTDRNNHKIRKINSGGVVTTFAGSTFGFADGNGISAQFIRPEGIAIDNHDNVFVSDQNHRIRKITPTGLVTTIAGSTFGYADGTGLMAQFNFPQGICFDTNGILYVTDTQNHKIRKIVID
jgi:sugar lactone lactonase YvrE